MTINNLDKRPNIQNSNPPILLIYGCTIHCRHYFCLLLITLCKFEMADKMAVKSYFYHNLRINATDLSNILGEFC